MTILSQRRERGEEKVRGEILITHNFHFQVVVGAGGIYSEYDSPAAGGDQAHSQRVSLSVRAGGAGGAAGLKSVLYQPSLPLPLVGGRLCKY